MSSPRHHIRTGRRGRGGHRARGFALTEMMLVLLILVLAVVLLFSVLGRVKQGRNRAQFVADLQEFASAFQDHRRQHRAWPASTIGEVALPRDLEEVLVETNWAGGSPFGGSYGWDRRGAVVLTAFAPSFPLKLTRADLLDLDRQLDDGNLATGRFRTGFNGWPVYFVEHQP